MSGEETDPAPSRVSPPRPSGVEIALVVLAFGSAARFGPGVDQPFGATVWLSAFAVLGLWVLHRNGRPGPGWTSEHPRRLIRCSVLGIAVGVTYWAVLGAMRLAYGWAIGGWPDALHPWWAVSSVYSVPWTMVGRVAVLAPVVEEVVFRGLLYRGLRQRLRGPAAVALSTAVFVVGHDAGNVIVAAMLGVVTALVYERTGTLLAPIAVHAACNLSMLVLGLAAHHLGGVPGVGY